MDDATHTTRKPELIFIVSQPRSGSTLLQALLANNDQVETANEPWLLLPLLSALKDDMSTARYNQELAAGAMNRFLGEKGERMQRWKDGVAALIHSVYTGKARYFLDKTPRYYEILDELPTYFPDAKIIVLQRNPFSVLSSIVETWAKNSFSRLAFYHRDILHAPLKIMEFAKAHQSNPNVLYVRYEDILTDPKKTVNRAYDFLGIPFSEDVLTNYRQSVGKKGFGDPVGIWQKDGVDQVGHDRWKARLENQKWAPFFKAYSDFLGAEYFEFAGYEKLPGQRSAKFNAFKKYAAVSEFEGKLSFMKYLKYKLFIKYVYR